MKNRDLSRIRLHKYAWVPSKVNKKTLPVAAYDTETNRGKAFLLGISDDREEKIFEIRDKNDYLSALTRPEAANKHNFFYNLTYDYQAVLKHLSRYEAYTIAETGAVMINGHLLEIVPHKLLKITTPENKTYKYYDLAQYYGFEKLEKLGQQYYGQGKDELPHDIKNLSPERYRTDQAYKEDLDKYLRRDCVLAKMLGERLVDACAPLLKPKTWYSQAGLSQQFYLERATRTIGYAPWPVMQASLYAYNGGRFETLRRGYIRGVKAYDIKSAYPYHASTIPAVDRGVWSQNDRYEPDADLSIMKVIAKGYTHIGLHRRETKTGLDYPTGKTTQWINKREYETYRLYGYDVKILKAYHFHAERIRGELEMPFSFMQEVYDNKERAGKDSPLYGVYKIIANGFYGKLIQMTPYYTTKYDKEGWPYRLLEGWKAGKLFNPVAAMEITANTRCQVAEAVVDDQESVVAFHTDSVFTTGKVNLKVGKRLGEWDDDGKKDLVIIGTGVYQFEKKEGEKAKAGMRGFVKKATFDYSTFKEDKTEIEFRVTRNRHLRLAVKREKDYDGFNILTDDIPRALDVNFDKKRIWDKDFSSARRVLEEEHSSKPFTISL